MFIYEKLHVHVFSKTLLGGGVYTKSLKTFLASNTLWCNYGYIRPLRMKIVFFNLHQVHFQVCLYPRSSDLECSILPANKSGSINFLENLYKVKAIYQSGIIAWALARGLWFKFMWIVNYFGGGLIVFRWFFVCFVFLGVVFLLEGGGGYRIVF